MVHNRCRQCLGPLNTHVSWKALFSWEKNTLCEACQESFTLLSPPWCLFCSRPLDVTDCCADCSRWAQMKHWSGLLKRNVSLFSYDESLQELISTFKYRGDVILADVFSEPLRRAYRTYFKGAIPVPIPLSKERLQERGFNQAAVLAEQLPVPYKFHLRRVAHEEKQSKRSRQARMRGEARPFAFYGDASHVYDKHILLIDDIYTTGTTLRKAARPLLEQGAGRVSALTVARG